MKMETTHCAYVRPAKAPKELRYGDQLMNPSYDRSTAFRIAREHKDENKDRDVWVETKTTLTECIDID